jgi:hypothetical protein
MRLNYFFPFVIAVWIVAWAFSGMVVQSGPAVDKKMDVPADNRLADFYNARIDEKINVAKRIEPLAESTDNQVKCETKTALKRADYYNENRKQLVGEMLKDRDIGTQDYKVDDFLVTNFLKAHPEANECKLS